jgi:uncharacterized protein (DUF1778 family)
MRTPEEIEAARLDPQPPLRMESISFTNRERDRALAALDRAAANVRRLEEPAGDTAQHVLRFAAAVLLDLEDVRRFLSRGRHPEEPHREMTRADILAREG